MSALTSACELKVVYPLVSLSVQREVMVLKVFANYGTVTNRALIWKFPALKQCLMGETSIHFLMFVTASVKVELLSINLILMAMGGMAIHLFFHWLMTRVSLSKRYPLLRDHLVKLVWTSSLAFATLLASQTLVPGLTKFHGAFVVKRVILTLSCRSVLMRMVPALPNWWRIVFLSNNLMLVATDGMATNFLFFLSMILPW
mmetsp:Transcript_1221/g.1599  ORF Transcript_1221/g.1599 Transcript_1221/m.1599 type:complete len:201 (+) Transcript_1221:452-1054(+)